MQHDPQWSSHFKRILCFAFGPSRAMVLAEAVAGAAAGACFAQTGLGLVGLAFHGVFTTFSGCLHGVFMVFQQGVYNDSYCIMIYIHTYTYIYIQYVYIYIYIDVYCTVFYYSLWCYLPLPGAHALWEYNRDNFLYDRKMRQETELKILEWCSTCSLLHTVQWSTLTLHCLL